MEKEKRIMTLTKDQRIAMIREYTPILFFHPDERFGPVRPDTFLLASSLWRGDQTGRKESWGLGGPGFPRSPLIPRGGISLNPAEDFEGTKDPDGDGVNEWYLGHLNTQMGIFPYLRSLEAEELWLDCSGWRDGDEVTTGSSNEACNLDVLAKRFDTEPLLVNARHSFFAEVMELDEAQSLLVSASTGSLDPVRLVRDLLGDVCVIWYYFLYPGHEEFLRRCEAFFDEKSDGNYEGDWNAVGVVVKHPFKLPGEPADPPFPPPSRVGYGVRMRGLAKDVVSSDTFKQGMTIHKWTEVEKHGNHPRVYVTSGYHNNYATPGEQVARDITLLNLEIGKIACGLGEGLSAITDEIKDTVSDAGETVKDVAVTLLKILAGAALFSNPIVGAIVGLAAGVAEASASSADHQPSADDWREREKEPGPVRGKYGLVLTPLGVPNPLVAHPDPAQNETATQVQTWRGADPDRLVDRIGQLWWPATGDDPGYNGRWGVRVQKDPMLRRSGIPFPDFRRSLMRELVESAIKD
jgi:hypothetical protein